jgi:hypothetical protein
LLEKGEIMRRPLLLAALVGTVLATPALADVTVRYRPVLPDSAPAETRANPPTLTVAADVAGQARMEMLAPGAPGTPRPGVAFITREGTRYVALNGPGPGMQVVARQEDVLALVSQFAAPLLHGSAQEGVRMAMQQRIEIQPVGPETVSGVQGNLYRFVAIMGETRSPPVEIVVATDPRMAPVGHEFARLAESLRPTVVSLLGGEPQAYMAFRGLMGLGAPLRIGDHVRIDSISTDDVPDSQFALPGPVMNREQLQQMASMMMGMMGRGRGAGAHAPGAPPSTPAPPATPPGNAANPH